MKLINQAFILAALCEQVKTVGCSFNFPLQQRPDGTIPKKSQGKVYTYMTLLDLEPGQDVIVETPDGLSVAQVVEVHDTAQIDPEAPFQYKWAVSTSARDCRQERTRIHEVVQDAFDRMSEGQERKRREESQRRIRQMLQLETGFRIDFGTRGKLDVPAEGSEE
jgi:hypothetical protein